MMLIDANTGQKVITHDTDGFTDPERQRINDFLMGAVYCWCNNKDNNWFSIKDILGRKNFYWEGTPLMVVFTKHEKLGKNTDDCIKHAGLDAGSLLKSFLDNKTDRTFKTKKDGSSAREYCWVETP